MANFRNEIVYSVVKESANSYTVEYKHYVSGILVKTEQKTYEVERDYDFSDITDPANGNAIVGILESYFDGADHDGIVRPNANQVEDVYDFVGEDGQIPLTGVNPDAHGYKYYFANMDNLKEVNLVTEYPSPSEYDPLLLEDSGNAGHSLTPLIRNEYAFYNCQLLTSINAGNLFNIGSACYWKAFYGCTSLTTITGTILLTHPKWCKDMFYGCTSLTGVRIDDANRFLNRTFNYNGQVMYGYEYLGFNSTDQFEIV